MQLRRGNIAFTELALKPKNCKGDRKIIRIFQNMSMRPFVITAARVSLLDCGILVQFSLYINLWNIFVHLFGPIYFLDFGFYVYCKPVLALKDCNELYL